MFCAEFCQLCGAVALLRMVAPWAGFHGVTFLGPEMGEDQEKRSSS